MSEMDPRWKAVAGALLGSWPSQVASWGGEALAAYIAEIGARGVGPDEALTAIRCCPAEQRFPPSAPELAALARRDPSAPTFDEALSLIRRALRAGRRPLTGDFSSEAAMIRAREDLVRDAAAGLHPLVAAFVGRCSDVGKLEDEVCEALSDGEFAAVRRRELAERWSAFCAAMEGREVAALASGRRPGLRQLDPLASIGVRVPAAEIEAGERS